MNRFRQMRLKYAKYYLKDNLIWTFQQHLNYRKLIANIFDGSSLKMKTATLI